MVGFARRQKLSVTAYRKALTSYRGANMIMRDLAYVRRTGIFWTGQVPFDTPAGRVKEAR